MNGLYGNFEKVVYKLSEIFVIIGRVLLVILEDVNLVVKLENGNIINGEFSIFEELKI